MCVRATTHLTPASTGFPNDSTYWDLHTEGQNYAGEWTVSTGYVVNDIVKEGGNQYICTNQHTSTGVQSNWYTNDFPQYWDLYAEGLNFRGAFTTDTYYGINDVVRYGGQEYRTTSPSFQVAADLTMQWISTSLHDLTGIGSDNFYPPTSNFTDFNKGFTNEGIYDAQLRYERVTLLSSKVHPMLLLVLTL